MGHKEEEYMSFLKKAFTLSEVLITLGIIGMVAALTMPTVIADYQKQETVTKLKKFYSVMNQTLTRAEGDYGPVEYWDFGKNTETIKFFNTYIAPYVQITKIYKIGDFPADITYKCLDGKECNSYGVLTANPKFVLSDGTMIISVDYIEEAETRTPAMNIIVDINGFKLPNKYGRDIFAFTIQQDKKFVPAGIGITNAETVRPGYDRDYILKGNIRGCSKNYHGFWCAALIMMDGWQISKDYPW